MLLCQKTVLMLLCQKLFLCYSVKTHTRAHTMFRGLGCNGCNITPNRQSIRKFRHVTPSEKGVTGCNEGVTVRGQDGRMSPSDEFSREFRRQAAPFGESDGGLLLNSLENLRKALHPCYTRYTLRNRVHALCLSALLHPCTLFREKSYTDKDLKDWKDGLARCAW